MKVFAEYHSHTKYSDGKATMEQMVDEASRLGYEVYGISDHGYRHNFFGVKREYYPKMRDEVFRLNELYPNMKILLGVEANILDDKGNIDVDDYIMNYVDYVIAGYHFGSKVPNSAGLTNHICNYFKIYTKNTVEYNTNALINAMKNNDIFILTHPGDKGRIYTREVAKVALDTNTVLEINAHHDNLSSEQLLEIIDLDIKYSLASDAHRPEHLKGIDIAKERAVASGVDISRIINVR